MTMAADLREQVIDKALRMDSATLERAGYVARRPDPSDGRASLFSLTPAGSAALMFC